MEVERKPLLAALKLVLPAMTQRELFEQSDKIAFVKGNAVAFNDAVAILHPLPGGLDFGDCAFDGKHLYDLLDKIAADTVDLTESEARIHLKSGRSRASFELLEVALPIDSVDMTGELVNLPDGFVDKLRWVSASCAKDMSRPALTCVSIENGWMQSSDSYRASRVQCDENLPRLMLPISQVEVLINKDYPIKRVALSDGKEWARFETDDNTTLCARSMSGSFPDLTKIYDVSGSEVQLTAALTEVIERARIFSQREHTIDEEITVTMHSNQSITVSAQYDGGKFSEDMRCRGAAEEAEFTIHPKFLSSALSSGTKCVLGTRSVKFSGADWEHVVSLKSR